LFRTLATLLTVSALVVAVVLLTNLVRGGSLEPVAAAAVAQRNANTAEPQCAPHWVAAWNASPVAASADAGPDRPEVGGRSLRMIVRPSVAGTQIRLLLSNRYGAQPLELRSVSAGLAGVGPALASPAVAVTFSGQPTGRVPAHDVLVSDPVPVSVSPASELAVSMFVPGQPAVVSEHPWALRTSYLSDPGDIAGSVDGSGFDHPVSSWLVLTGVDVQTARTTNAVLLMGDSITDGVGSSPNTDRRVSDDLAQRLATLGGAEKMAVLNAGISGNRLLADYPSWAGEPALNRLGWEVVGRPGVTDVILHAGTNDLAAGASARSVVDGMVQFVDEAHRAGLRVFLTTITPADTGPHGTAAAVAARQEVNDWVRSQGRSHADGVFDFAAAVADVSRSSRLVASFDAGDGLHLSDSGYEALANAVDPTVLSGSRCLA